MSVCFLSALSSTSTSGRAPSPKVPVRSAKWDASPWCVLACLAGNIVFIFWLDVEFSGPFPFSGRERKAQRARTQQHHGTHASAAAHGAVSDPGTD